MANYAASVFAKAQMILNERFQAAEMRAKPSPTLMMLLKYRDFLIPNIQVLRDREDRATKAYLKNRAARSLSSARAATHTGATADSTEVAIEFTTYQDKFATSLKRGDNNVFPNAVLLAHEIENSLINLHEGIETALVTWLDSNKNQVSAPASGTLRNAIFNATNDVYEVSSADAEEYFHIMKSIFRQEKYSGGVLDVIADASVSRKAAFQSQQGQGNSTNLGWQMSGLDISESVEIYDADYAAGLSYAVPMGMAGIIDWIPKANREGYGDIESYNGAATTIIDPMTGLPFALHAYTEKADTSASNGNVQDWKTEYELSIDLSPQKAPISTANQTPIFAIAQTT